MRVDLTWREFDPDISMEPLKSSEKQLPMVLQGSVIDAVVTQIEQYGAWIDYKGLRGLVTIPEVSWSRISHPAEVLSVGQIVRVKVLLVSSDQFAASIRAAHPDLDPWRDPRAFDVGAEFVGTVVKVLKYGCFVELKPEVWGLLRRERWHANVAIHDRLHVRVENVDPQNRKIDLSLLAANDEGAEPIAAS